MCKRRNTGLVWEVHALRNKKKNVWKVQTFFFQPFHTNHSNSSVNWLCKEIQRVLTAFLPCWAGLRAPGWDACGGNCWECLCCCCCCVCAWCCCGKWDCGWDTCDCGWICPGEDAEGDKWPAAARTRSSAALSCSWWNCWRSARSCWRWYSNWEKGRDSLSFHASLFNFKDTANRSEAAFSLACEGKRHSFLYLTRLKKRWNNGKGIALAEYILFQSSSFRSFQTEQVQKTLPTRPANYDPVHTRENTTEYPSPLSVVRPITVFHYIDCCTVLLSTHRLALPVHDGLKFFKVAKFNFQFLHLSLHQQCHKTLDLSLFNLSQMLRGKQMSGYFG